MINVIYLIQHLRNLLPNTIMAAWNCQLTIIQIRLYCSIEFQDVQDFALGVRATWHHLNQSNLEIF